LGWLHGGEIFLAAPDDLTVTHGLPPGMGALKYSLLAVTTLDPALMVDVILAYTTLTGLNPGKWAARLAQFAPVYDGLLFSTLIMPTWTSCRFCETFVIPLLEVQCHTTN
jgi:hypothetical protein